MIKPIKAYQTSDGTACASLEEAQHKELRSLFLGLHAPGGLSDENPHSVDNEIREAADEFASTILNQRDHILDILATGPRSRTTRRKVNGAPALKRKRKTEFPPAELEG